MKNRINLFVILLLGVVSFIHGQLPSYSYQRQLTDIKDSWHSIALPVEVLAKTKKEVTDIRIYGIKEDADTVEAPYILRILADRTVNKEVEFNIINTASGNGGYYYTFEVGEEQLLNTIELAFNRLNFDWKVRLDGSPNQREWFTLLNDYRMVSIHNSMTSFSFTTLTFPSSKYRFYRLFVPGNLSPDLTTASIRQLESQAGNYRKVTFATKGIREERDSKQTIIDLSLATRTHMSKLTINVLDTFDYYRPVKISYLRDSFETQQGWKYQYQTISSGTLNSLAKNEFPLGNIAAKQFRVIVENQDNQPLTIGAISGEGNRYELITRFTEKATYYLAYGNKDAGKPLYDLARFKESIPITLTPLTLGNEIALAKTSKEVSIPLFENKGWLWLLMTLIILILGWFSIQMMRKTDKT